MFDVVSVGSATQDVFIKSDLTKIIRLSDVVAEKEFLCYDYGSKVNIDDIQFLTGGGASNTAVSFARLGLKSAFVGKVGKNDDAGMRVIRELESEGVDVRHAKYSGTYSTGYSVILVSYEGDRTVLTFRGANNSLDESDIDPSVFGETLWLYMSGLSGRSAEMATALARRASEAGVKLAFNPGSSQLKTKVKGLRDILAVTEILVVNRQEAEAVTGIEASRQFVDTQACNLCGKCVDACPSGIFQKGTDSILVRNADLCLRCGRCARSCPKDAVVAEPWTYNLRAIFAALLEAGAKTVAITDGRTGSQACDGTTLYMSPAYTAPTVDTLGAGDAFGSAFVTGMIKGAGIARSLQMGAANGSSVVRYFGAKPGLLTLDEIDEFMSEKASDEAYFVRTMPLTGNGK